MTYASTEEKPSTRQTPTDPRRRLRVPDNAAAVVRMYRIGHGDCFLLAFGGVDKEKPSYVLVDCGYKPGSPGYIKPVIKDRTKAICEDIRQATGGYIDVAIITHEHQDHVNNISEKSFAGIEIGESWFAWTEDPNDDLANDLRRKFKDKLLGLVHARNRLAAGGDTAELRRLNSFLEFEFGGEKALRTAADFKAVLKAAAPNGESANKKSMKVFKDLANNRVRYLRPHQSVIKIPGSKSARVFVLGPPQNEIQMRDLDPQGTEEFRKIALASAGNYFAAAAQSSAHGKSPNPRLRPDTVFKRTPPSSTGIMAPFSAVSMAGKV